MEASWAFPEPYYVLLKDLPPDPWAEPCAKPLCGSLVRNLCPLVRNLGALDLLRYQLVPSWYQLVPAGTQLVPSWYKLGTS